MQEKTLINISLAVIVVGLLFLSVYAEEIQLNSTNKIDNIPLGEEVKIEGKVVKLRQTDKVLFLTIDGQKTETMDIVAFPDEDIFVKEGSIVEIMGKTEEYQGKKEIIANSIVLK